ncbi:MAG TPA: DUF4199 domain-containing protein [Flavobacterium sp.]|jgi:hypothetical protein|nr:DUF4199 domain-containing protein [Flavobacterium sp.]
MENKVSASKSGILLGVIFGIIMVLEFVIMYVVGMKSLVDTSIGLIVNIANYMILPIIFIYLGCNNYKNNINNGFISFIECLKTGVSITFIAAFVYALFSLVFNFIFPEFIDEMLSISKDAMLKKNPKMTSAEVETGVEMIKKFMNPVFVFPVTLAMYSFLGLIYSLIVGAFLKKDNPQSF